MMFRLCSLLLVLLLCGCSEKQDDLTGMWEVPVRFPGMSPPQITFSADGTGRVRNAVVGEIPMNWRRLDRGRFTLTQADGATWAGCLSEGEINLREPVRTNGRGRIFRYHRVYARHGGLVFREKTRSSPGLTCIP